MNALKICKLLGMIEFTKISIIISWMTMMVGGDMEEDLVVDTASGKVRGERMISDTGKKFDIWRSIPFAEPPVGNLR